MPAQAATRPSKADGTAPSFTPTSGTRRSVNIASLFATGTSVFISVDTWPVPERPGTTLTPPEQNTHILNKPTKN